MSIGYLNELENSPFNKDNFHITVWLKGKCIDCNKNIEEEIFDYKVKPFFEVKKLVNFNHYKIKELTCTTCKKTIQPEYLIHQDDIHQIIVDEHQL